MKIFENFNFFGLKKQKTHLNKNNRFCVWNRLNPLKLLQRCFKYGYQLKPLKDHKSRFQDGYRQKPLNYHNSRFWDGYRQNLLHYHKSRFPGRNRLNPVNYQKTWTGPRDKFPSKKLHEKILGKFFQKNDYESQKFHVFFLVQF